MITLWTKAALAQRASARARWVVCLAAGLSYACASATPAPQAPNPTEQKSTPAKPAPAREAPDRSGLPAAPAGVPAAPSACSAFQTPASCVATDAADALERLAGAAETQDPLARDEALAALESCDGFELGLLRSLRAEVAPRGCGDVIAEPFLAEHGASLRAELLDALRGGVLAARLSRLPTDPPPVAAGERSKEQLKAYTQGPFAEWLKGQTSAIFATASAGATLRGYGKALVAVESGVADMRLVELARQIPIPEEMAKDPELSEAYYASLDQALEPRKRRGRDAALVGLGKLAELGVLRSERVTRARTLLSNLFGGRRIDALDGLLLPPLPAWKPTSVQERLAVGLPTIHAASVLAANVTEPGLLRAWLESGLPPEVQQRFESGASDKETAALYARGLVRLGQTYWRSQDFRKAADLFGGVAKEKGSAPEARLVNGLAVALRGGPRDAAEMMLKGPVLPSGVGDVSELDLVAEGKGEIAAMAAFDAAHILALAPPPEHTQDYWREVVRRFQRAEKLFRDPKLRALSAERRKAAEETAKAVPR